MRYYKNLLLGDNMEDVDEIIENLDNGTPTYNIFLICIDEKNQNLFEVMRATEIFKAINSSKDYIIVGMTRGEKSAFGMVKDIIQKCVDENKNINDIKNVFVNNTL